MARESIPRPSKLHPNDNRRAVPCPHCPPTCYVLFYSNPSPPAPVPLLRDLLNHPLGPSQTSRASTIWPPSLHKQPARRAIQHLLRHSDALARPVADPADKDGFGAPGAVGVLSFFADGLEALAVGLAGLLLEELVDRLLLRGG